MPALIGFSPAQNYDELSNTQMHEVSKSAC